MISPRVSPLAGFLPRLDRGNCRANAASSFLVAPFLFRTRSSIARRLMRLARWLALLIAPWIGGSSA